MLDHGGRRACRRAQLNFFDQIVLFQSDDVDGAPGQEEHVSVSRRIDAAYLLRRQRRRWLGFLPDQLQVPHPWSKGFRRVLF